MSSKSAEAKQKTFLPEVDPNKARWWLVDMEGQVLGRVAVRVADILRGKNKPTFTPHLDTGDHVVVINAEKVKVTGNKSSQMKYYRYSGYPGGLKETSFNQMKAKHPERIIEHAVRGMLPKNRLGRKIFKKLHVYAGPEHPHQSQNPQALK